MSGEQDAKARLEAVIAKHVYSGNVIPFPTMPKPQHRRKPPPPPSRVSIRGTGNAAVVGSHNQVTINVSRRKVVADVRPGKDHITDEQAARLQQLVHDIHARTQREFQAIWSALLRHVQAPKYRLIRLERFPEAEAYLVRWLGRAAPQDETDEQMRKRHIRYIKTNQRKLGRPDEDVAQFVQEHFGKEGLRTCTAEELAIVRTQLVESWRHIF